MTHPLETVEIHPLFPVEADDDDDEVKPIANIHICRKENGKLMFAPRPRPASELTSIEQIHAEFGGGEYQLVGYYNGRISARRTINIPGKSKPMFDEGLDTPVATQVTSAPAQAQVLDPMQQMMGQGGGGIMGLIMMMMQQMMQQSAAAQAQQTQLFMAMFQNGSERTKEERAEQQRSYELNIERERIASERQMTMLREMMANRPSAGPGDDFAKGVEFMRSFATMQIETARSAAKESGEDGIAQLLETGVQALQGFMALKHMKEDAVGAAVSGAVGG